MSWNKLAEPGETPIEDAIADHECNPEYEVHLGQVVDNDGARRRYVSVWLRGRRWSGWLEEVELRAVGHSSE